MAAPISNDAFQNWLMNVLEHPGSDDEAWNSPGTTRHLTLDVALANVLPSKTLGPMERIAIYRRMFYLRMTDAMEIDYPGVLHALGRESFRRLIANDYIERYPSQSYSLNHLGRSFPTFLAESGMAHASFLSDLARLELTISDLMDEREPTETISPSLEDVPPGLWEGVRIHFIPALGLLSSAYPVDQYLSDLKNNQGPSIPTDPEQSWTMVYRRDFEMNFEPISKDEYDLLSSLTKGWTIGDSLAALFSTTTSSAEILERSLFAWFRRWMEIGIIHRIELPAQS